MSDTDWLGACALAEFVRRGEVSVDAVLRCHPASASAFMTEDGADGTDVPAVELARGRNALRLEVVELAPVRPAWPSDAEALARRRLADRS